MNFDDCKEALAEGRRARRKSWQDSGEYIKATFYFSAHADAVDPQNCTTHLIGNNKRLLPWTWDQRWSDIAKDDWEIMPEPDYKQFGKAVYHRLRCDQDYEEVEIDWLNELAEQCGLCHLVLYDSEIHGVVMDADIGDKIYYFEDGEL